VNGTFAKSPKINPRARCGACASLTAAQLRTAQHAQQQRPPTRPQAQRPAAARAPRGSARLLRATPLPPSRTADKPWRTTVRAARTARARCVAAAKRGRARAPHAAAALFRRNANGHRLSLSVFAAPCGAAAARRACAPRARRACTHTRIAQLCARRRASLPLRTRAHTRAEKRTAALTTRSSWFRASVRPSLFSRARAALAAPPAPGDLVWARRPGDRDWCALSHTHLLKHARSAN
jgi:hypothetical protein